MRLDEHELQAIADRVAERLLPRLLAELRRSNGDSQFLDLGDAAKRLGVSSETLRREAAAGQISGAVKVGRQWRFEADRLAKE